MPKATKPKTTSARTSSATKRKEAGPPPDPSRWRASRVGIDTTITKTDATTQYRLTKPNDLAGLPFTTIPARVHGQRDMQLYKERDVERRAWERHGGPEGFEAYLEKLYQRHLNSKNKDRPFPQPRQYSFGRKATNTVEARISSAYKRLAATKSRIEKSMQPWLFDAVKKALDRNDELNYEFAACYGPGYGSPTEEEKSWLLAETFARTYPPRPAQSLPSSPSVDAVRAILSEAATPPRRDDPKWGCDLDGLEFHSSSWPDDEEWYEWSPGYLERLFSALIRVIEEHGPGDDGWKGIRWEVYDKYAATFRRPISYDEREKQWQDDAAHWLDGQYTTEGSVALDVSRRRCCSAGKRYNSMLPKLYHVGWPQ